MARKIEADYEFDTEEKAEAFATQFRAAYGLGYDGKARVVPPKVEGEKWTVSTTRYDSCD